VPSLGLVVAGDVVYNGVHQMLLETGETGFQTWLAALDTVEALHPRAVIAGHKDPDLPDDPATIDETRQYLRDAEQLLAKSPTPQEFFDEIIARYPDRLNVGPVWYGAHGLLGVEMPS
jgi:L-ascorbate metabolism protein UlaG (beta-lactamase superfamily)